MEGNRLSRKYSLALLQRLGGFSLLSEIVFTALSFIVVWKYPEKQEQESMMEKKIIIAL